MIDKKLFDKIYNIHIKELNHIDVPHKKLITCFEGIPCSGKTHLSQILEKRYEGVRISNDRLREIILDIFPNKNGEERQGLLQDYLKLFLKKWDKKNKFILLDSGIERKYSDIKKIADAGGYNLFIININVKKDILLERIKKKDYDRFTNHFEDIERWFREYKEFNSKVKSDFVIKNNSDKGLKKLFKILDNLIK